MLKSGQLALRDAREMFRKEARAMTVDKAMDVLNRERLFRMTCEQSNEPSDDLMQQRPSWQEVVQAVFVLREVNHAVIPMMTLADFSHVFVNFDLPPLLEYDLKLIPRAIMLN